MKLDELRLIVKPGKGLVARFGSTVLLVADAADAATTELIAAARSIAGDAGDALFEVVRARRPSVVTPFCAVLEDGGELRIAIHGPLEVTGEATTGRIRFAGRDANSRVEESLGSEVSQLSVAEHAPKPASDPLLDLVEGVVPGSAFTLASREVNDAAVAEAPAAVPAPTTPLAPVPEQPAAAPALAEPSVPVAQEPAATPSAGEARPAADMTPVQEPLPAPAVQQADVPPSEAPPAPAEAMPTILGPPPTVDMARADVKRALTMAMPAVGPAPAHAEAPEVDGRLCSGGHLNSPTASACWICGAGVGAETARGPRPPLGRLTTKDKRAFIVDGNFVIGRSPSHSPEVTEGRARGIDVPAEEQTVSRTHAEIRLEGWDVMVYDLGSSNGTYYLAPKASEWVRVEGADGVPILPGTTITLGGFELFFEGL